MPYLYGNRRNAYITLLKPHSSKWYDRTSYLEVKYQSFLLMTTPKLQNGVF